MEAQTRKTEEHKVWSKVIWTEVKIHDREEKRINDSTVQQKCFGGVFSLLFPLHLVLVFISITHNMTTAIDIKKGTCLMKFIEKKKTSYCKIV